MVDVHSVGIAGSKVVGAPDCVRTVLGSCIGIAIYDPQKKIGALGHIMLPNSDGAGGDRGKYADTGVDWLVEQLAEEGVCLESLQAKIAGGATMFGNNMNSGIGERNTESVITRLEHHDIPLIGSFTGGAKGIKMHFYPETGIVEVASIGEKPRKI